MKVLLMKKPGDVKVTEPETPQLKEHEVLIRVRMAGICTNDVRDYKGDCSYSYPRIGGHEYAGTIAKMGSGVDTKRFQEGMKVVPYIINIDRNCHLCRTGNENICLKHPNSYIFHNEGGISGYGGFGECVVAKLRGANIIVSEPLAERREKALELGAKYVIDPINQNAVDEVMRITKDQGAKVVFNTTASPALMAQAMDMTGPCGTCVAFSSMHPNNPIEVDAGALHTWQKTLTGVVSPTIKAYYQSYELINKGIIDPTVLTEDIFDYTDFDNAMGCALRPDTYKVLIRFGDEQ